VWRAREQELARCSYAATQFWVELSRAIWRLNPGQLNRILAFSSELPGNWKVFEVDFDRLRARDGSLTVGKAVFLS
jgi:hypothetical protein